ncbi:unnamed protein product [Linum tenue]|uniref:Smr domain-containing protein n=1 Tax=Linum tenue TaxID=586396 RepID=A0AAV0PC61_9ROSI|nr:unnamed protein product [Linum tenue]
MKERKIQPSFGIFSALVDSMGKAGRLDTSMKIYMEMQGFGHRPSATMFVSLIESYAKSGKLDRALRLWDEMKLTGFRPNFGLYTLIIESHAKSGKLDIAMSIFSDMEKAGFLPTPSTYSFDLALRWLRFMGSSGIRTNNFIIRQLFESCMKNETYINSAAKVDLILYTSILAHLVRCQDEQKERHLMSILGSTRHRAHEFMKQPVLSFVREFFQGIDYELEEGAARYFVNINRARCVWKVAYENKLFPKAIVFDQHIAWSLDVRNLSVGAALIAVVHTLHRFRKRMLYYGVIPRRIKLVTGPTLKIVVAQMLSGLESPFEVSKKPIVQQFLVNDIPSRADILMHKLNILFPSSAPEIRSLSPPKPLMSVGANRAM